MRSSIPSSGAAGGGAPTRCTASSAPNPCRSPVRCPHALQIAAGRQILGPAVLERDIADLSAFGRAAMLGTEPLGCMRDLTVAL